MPQTINYTILSQQIKDAASNFGFLGAGIANIKIDPNSQSKFNDWLSYNFYGDMEYLTKNTDLRFNPERILPDTLSCISVKVPYLTNSTSKHIERLEDANQAYISSYALGRDYHKVVKKQLKQYATWVSTLLIEYGLNLNYRVFTDSAPILEVELAGSAGLGWRGKNTLLLNKNQGSMFFLGEIFTNLPLVVDTTTSNHCGSCTKCMTVCPTNAFESAYVLNAKKCISYLTIENKGHIPLEFRKAIGNRIYGCDDCQLFCPWNKFSKMTTLTDFATRHNLDSVSLVEAFSWTEEEWSQKMQGSPIYRIGYTSWLRNVAVALGNATTSAAIVQALQARIDYPSEIVREHVGWALQQHILLFTA